MMKEIPLKELTDTVAEQSVFSPDIPELLPLTTLAEIYRWYRLNLCQPEITDCRGYRVRFQDTDFVHLIKLTDKYGVEPKNRRMSIEQIESGRIKLAVGRFDARRTQELTWARSIIQAPTMIVPNWQVMGRANPGEAYIKNFGTEQNPIYRVLVCGFAGKLRRPVTIFARERFAARDIHPVLWP